MNLKDRLAANQTYFIAEMSANHGGSFERAMRIVDLAKESGADCLKLQTYTADTMTLDSDKEEFMNRGGLWDGTSMYDLYKSAYTPWEWHDPIKRRCDELGLDFLSSPFDATSVDFLERFDPSAYKIASFELTDIPLVRYAASKGRTINHVDWHRDGAGDSGGGGSLPRFRQRRRHPAQMLFVLSDEL